MARILTTQQINERNQVTAAAEQHAAEDPTTLTIEEVGFLSGATTSRLAAAGMLAHLGVGKARGMRRRP